MSGYLNKWFFGIECYLESSGVFKNDRPFSYFLIFSLETCSQRPFTLAVCDKKERRRNIRFSCPSKVNGLCERASRLKIHGPKVWKWTVIWNENPNSFEYVIYLTHAYNKINYKNAKRQRFLKSKKHNVFMNV